MAGVRERLEYQYPLPLAAEGSKTACAILACAAATYPIAQFIKKPPPLNLEPAVDAAESTAFPMTTWLSLTPTPLPMGEGLFPLLPPGEGPGMRDRESPKLLQLSFLE